MNWNSCMQSGVATLNCVPLLIINLIYWALALAGTVGVIIIIVGGISFILSGGDPKKTDEARRTVLFAILGLIIVFLAFFIIDLIGSFTGVACLKTTNLFSFDTCI